MPPHCFELFPITTGEANKFGCNLREEPPAGFSSSCMKNAEIQFDGRRARSGRYSREGPVVARVPRAEARHPELHLLAKSRLDEVAAVSV